MTLLWAILNSLTLIWRINMLRRRTLVKEKVEAVIPESDIVLYDSQLNKEIVICNIDYNLTDYPKDRFTPIGVVVIPQDHAKVIYPEGHACYNKPVMMSLKYMSYEKPDTGDDHLYTLWGGNTQDTLPKDYKNIACINNLTAEETSISSSDSSVYIPSDRFSGVESKAAPKTKYYKKPFAPSPFLFKDGIWGPNPAYYNCPADCMQYDRDGKGNTATILELVTAPDWKTASSITNNGWIGNYPAACCCWRFHTIADNQGDWYLPATGELCYIIPFFNKHNRAINRIKSIYGDNSIAFVMVNYEAHWTSNEYSSTQTCFVSPEDGSIGNFDTHYALYVRAFRPVKI